MRRVILSSFIFITFTACASTNSYYLPDNSRSTRSRRHLVKKGDSLWRISKKYGVSVKELMRENKIKSASRLEAGQVINIPRAYKESLSSFCWPIKGEIVSHFGESFNNVVNRGVNVKVKEDDAVCAAASGRAVFCNYLKGWGQTLILKHNRDFYTIYANLTDNQIKEGRYVKKGEVIGQVAGTNGRIFHFEIRKKHLALNPLKYLR
jgi:murein DD-endopeptidase MepM/ murein hydrolase activator NlpD